MELPEESSENLCKTNVFWKVLLGVLLSNLEYNFSAERGATALPLHPVCWLCFMRCLCLLDCLLFGVSVLLFVVRVLVGIVVDVAGCVVVTSVWSCWHVVLVMSFLLLLLLLLLL